MAKSAEALINPELLVWARRCAGMQLREASDRLRLAPEKLESWENGSEHPTVKQVRTLANVYKQSFAAFYLPRPPAVFRPPLHDYRRLLGADEPRISPELLLDIRLSAQRRDVCLELLGDLGEVPPVFHVTTTIRRKPESLASSLRSLLGVTMARQQTWNEPRVAFNHWREAIENIGILVFQSTRVPLDEMRGYSLAEFPQPVIVVNRKDTYNGRIFTLLHEFTHLLLRAGGVCDLETQSKLATRERRIEVFCNHVSGATLVPENDLLDLPNVAKHQGTTWGEDLLDSLSRKFRVSREVVLRRLLILGRTSQSFYEQKRAEYRKQYERRQRGKARSQGGPSPSVNVVSAAGKPFVRVVLEAFYAEKLTTSDVSDFLGVKMQHLQPIGEAVGMG